MNTENINLIGLVNYEAERRVDENGHLSDDDMRFVIALQRAVNSFFEQFGHFYWDDATVEIRSTEQVNDSTKCSYILTTEIDGQTYQKELKPDDDLVKSYTDFRQA